jgi:hypothetical protein
VSMAREVILDPVKYEKIQVCKSTFKLVPESLELKSWSPADELKQEYRNCYRVIFQADGYLSRECSEPENVDFVLKNVASLKCTLRIFLLVVMWAHKTTFPNVPFQSKLLLSPSARRRVINYRKQVEDMYGVLTEKTLEDYTDENLVKQSAENILEQTEFQVGSWVVGYKQRNSGKVNDFLYQSEELRLAPLWLALESSYQPYLTIENSTVEQQKLRVKVCKLIGQLKKDTKRARALFELRQRVMPKVIEKVLSERSLNHELFLTDTDRCWTSSIDFWVKLGLAVQHYWCINWYYQRNGYSLKQLQKGTLGGAI